MEDFKDDISTSLTLDTTKAVKSLDLYINKLSDFEKNISKIAGSVSKELAGISNFKMKDYSSQFDIKLNKDNSFNKVDLKKYLRLVGGGYKKTDEYANFKDVYDLKRKIKKNQYENLQDYFSKTQKITPSYTKGVQGNALLSSNIMSDERFAKYSEMIEKLSTDVPIYNRALYKTNTETANLNKNTDFSSNSLIKLATSISVLTYGLRKITNLVSNYISLSINYIENINLLGVSMGSVAEEAQTFANNLAKAFMLDPSMIIRYIGLFQELESSLGLTNKQASVLSENYTKLGIDLASLLNIDVETVYSKIQSGISGITRPLKQIGIDVTQNALEYTASLEAQKAFAKGNVELGNALLKTSNSWSTAEKQQLIYLTILRETADSQGDFARTFDEPAQQLRVFTNQITILQRNIGNLFQGVVAKILPYINAYMLVINDQLATLAGLLGYVEASASDAASIAGTDVEDVNNSLDDTSDKINNLIGGLDKFNVLSSKTDSSSGFAGLELPDYDMNLENINSKTSEIYESLSKFAPVLSALTVSILAITSVVLWEKFSSIAGKAFGSLTLSAKELDSAIVGGILAGTLALIINWDKLSTQTKILATSLIALSTVYEVIKNKQKILTALEPLTMWYTKLMDKTSQEVIANSWGATFGKVSASSTKMKTSVLNNVSAIGIAMASLAITLTSVFSIISNYDNMSTAQRWVAIIGTVASTVFGLAAAFEALKGNFVLATVYSSLSLIGGIATQLSTTQKFAEGGFPEKGQLFVANEAGPELVGKMGGRTTVANNQQITDGIRQAAYEGMRDAMANNGGNNNITISLDGGKMDNNAIVRALAPSIRAYLKNNGGKF